MKTHKEVEDFLLSFPNTRLDYPFGEEVAVYKVKHKDKDEKMFALIPHDKTPVNLSLKCDPKLAVVLRDNYESVMPGYHLSKKHWNTILLTGQLNEVEIKDLITHSYNLVTENPATIPTFK